MLAACGGPAAPADSAIHVCVAANADGLVHSFNQLAVDGARSAGAALQVVPARAVTEYLSNLQRCVEAHPALVVAVSAEMANAVWRTARTHPSQRFALVDAVPLDDGGQPDELANVTSLLFKAQESAYLVGALAGLLEKNKIGSATHSVVGVLGFDHSPRVDAYIAGFVAGARAVAPDIKIKVTYSDSQEPSFCKQQIGINQISAGADILFEVTGHCASGYIDAAYDSGVYAIGSDTDRAYLSPAVITSALKRVDRAVALTVQRLQSGRFKSGKQLLGIADDATGLSTPSSVVPQDIINQVVELRAKIRNGTITPPETVPPGI